MAAVAAVAAEVVEAEDADLVRVIRGKNLSASSKSTKFFSRIRFRADSILAIAK